ncbi:MAG: ATP-binding cassette domain-containing protein [Bacteroidetes bacterium]|nr:ATP-binding cassette domain-containing protein [Bacteroidota bacterium]
MDYVIEIENLKKTFEDKEILKGINLHLPREENLAVCGKSGIGKTVLIKCMVGLMQPDSGKINVLGKDMMNPSLKDLEFIRRKIGFVFQGSALYDSMSVRENLSFTLKRSTFSGSKTAIAERVEEVLESVGLVDAIDKMPAELSGGMKKRVGLARTLIKSPEIILYDEPTTGLDPATSMEINEMILDVRKSNKVTSVIITHDMNCVRMTSDRMLIIHDGLIYTEGTFEQLKSSDDPWISSFFNKKEE